MLPDSGSSGADFPGGSSAQLYDSISAILALPEGARVFVGHDYALDREAACEATVAEHRAHNVHWKDNPTHAQYRAVRDARDATLAPLQTNIRGGRLPTEESNGRPYLKVPLNYLESR